MQRLDAMLQDNPALRAAAIGGGVVVLFYLLAWLLVGRDPRRGTIIPLFAPPAGMSAAAVRFVEEMSFDDRVFAAAIVGLGVNGHLKLVDKGADRSCTTSRATASSMTPRGRREARCSPSSPRWRSTSPTPRRSAAPARRCTRR